MAPTSRTIGFLLFDGLHSLDLFGPLEAFQEVNESLNRAAYDVVLVSETGAPVQSSSGVSIAAMASIARCPSLDTLVIPGGRGAREESFSPVVLDWIRQTDAQRRRTGSVCTGLFVLARTGLVENQRVTTHWRHVEEARLRFPNLIVDAEKLFCYEDKYFTAAGVTSGIDVALALIEEDHGARVAAEIARQLVVFVRRPGDQRQFSSLLQAQVDAPDRFNDLVGYIADHLHEDLSAFALAAHVGLGERQFRRRFKKLFGETPVRYVERARLEAARNLLVGSRTSIEAIAREVGFSSADVFTRAFERSFAVSPSEYRARFASPQLSRRTLVRGASALVGVSLLQPAAAASTRYVCPPCGCGSDSITFDGPGRCPSCAMHLEPEKPPFEPQTLPRGASAFFTAGGLGHSTARVRVHTYVPHQASNDSPLLIVIPGAGRDGAEYRDAWVEAAERASVVVAALTYSEDDYDFAAYHMGGVIRRFELENATRRPPNQVHVRDEDIAFEVEPNPRRWLFDDFDRIHRLTARAAGLDSPPYDLFGHSAGGQVLHRAVLLASTNARRIVAANSGFYTMPDRGLPLPFGLGGLEVSNERMREALAKPLTVLLGEKDDRLETRGTLLRTPTVDRFGLGRLSRGTRFYEQARECARELDVPFAWSLERVPGVGHDFRAMSDAAASLLYGDRHGP